jgi:phospholipid:diacylglycerol acyltransferase
MQIELFRLIFDERILIAGHSWGDNVVRAFLHWMEEQQAGWVDKHIAVVFNCGGPVLGTPKAITSLLSGEVRESAKLTGIANLIGEGLLGKEDRTAIWRTWGSPLGMLPIGGENIWGNATYAADDDDRAWNQNTSFGCDRLQCLCAWARIGCCM